MRKHNLQSGDLAWGKIKGYPWWPGKVIYNFNTN